MLVEKIVNYTQPAELAILGVTLLSENECKTLLTLEERKYSSPWWLKTPGKSDKYCCYAGCVYSSGRIYLSSKDISFKNVAIRPALQIKLSEFSPFKIGDTFILNGYKFKIISDKLAFMYEQDIGKSAFKYYVEGEVSTNNYDVSDVKKVVDNWFIKT